MYNIYIYIAIKNVLHGSLGEISICEPCCGTWDLLTIRISPILPFRSICRFLPLWNTAAPGTIMGNAEEHYDFSGGRKLKQG